MSAEVPPVNNLPIFNSTNYEQGSTLLTIDEANATYLLQSGGTLTGNLSIGTAASIAYPLNVSRSVSAVNVGTNTTLTYNLTALSGLLHDSTNLNASICARFHGNVLVDNSSAIYLTSDERVKENFESIDIDVLDNMRQVQPCIFNYKEEPNKKRIGFKAQDLVKADMVGLISVIRDDSIEEAIINGDKYPAGIKLVVDYNAIIGLNTARILDLEKKIAQLESKISQLI